MKICNSCGAEMNDNDRFCMSCGADQRVAETTETTTPVTETPAEEVVTPAAEPASYSAPSYETVTPAPTYNYEDPTVASSAGDGKATASMVCGIVGLVLCCCGPLGIAALILGILAKKDGNTSGKATAGIVMGAIIIVIWLISVIMNFATGTYADIMSQF